jgi:hypothetical protein
MLFGGLCELRIKILHRGPWKENIKAIKPLDRKEKAIRSKIKK